MINGKIPDALSPSYPWGQGDPQQMAGPDVTQGAFESPPKVGGGGMAVAVVAVVGVVAGGLLARKLFRRRRR